MTQTLAQALDAFRARKFDVSRTIPAIMHDTRIAFVKLRNDEFAEDPTEGRIFSFNSRHRNFIKPEQRDEITHDDCVALSYFEHGQCLWDVAGDGFTSKHPGTEFRWDGVEFAGLYVPDADTIEEVNKLEPSERFKALCDLAETACEEHTQWCNGDVYEYDITVYELRHDANGEAWDRASDYRRDAEVETDICSGFYGYDSLCDAVVEALPTLL